MRGALVGLLFIILTGGLRGDVLIPYDNLGTTSGYVFNGSYNSYAQSFTTGDFAAFGGSAAVKTIRMNLFVLTNTSTDTTFSVGIYSNSGSQPNSLVAGSTLFNSTSSNLGTQASSVYSIDVTSNNISLASNTAYWLVVQRGSYTAGTNDLISWALGAPGSAGSAKQSPNSGSSWTDIPNGAQFGGQIVMVPEPGTILLGGIAAACGGGGVWWRRRGKAKAAEAVEHSAAV